MNLRDLEYLLAVAKHRNFHKAAEACFVSQPTLSTQLKKLEQYLDVTLIERNPGNILITDIGRQILERAQLIINYSDDIRQIAKQYGDINASTVELGLIPTIAPYLLPKISASIKVDFPRLDLKLHEYQTHKLVLAIQHGELDAAIMALPIKQSLDGFKVLHLYNEEFFLALNSRHRLAARKRLSLADIKDLDIVLLEKGHCLRDHAADLCKLVDANTNNIFTATSLETLRHMITVNEVITLMPRLAIDFNRPEGNIHYIPFTERQLSRQVVLVFRKSSHKYELFERFAKLIQDAVSSAVQNTFKGNNSD